LIAAVTRKLSVSLCRFSCALHGRRHHQEQFAHANDVLKTPSAVLPKSSTNVPGDINVDFGDARRDGAGGKVMGTARPTADRARIALNKP
jgi:cell division GTPase FtsZ